MGNVSLLLVGNAGNVATAQKSGTSHTARCRLYRSFAFNSYYNLHNCSVHKPATICNSLQTATICAAANELFSRNLPTQPRTRVPMRE